MTQKKVTDEMKRDQMLQHTKLTIECDDPEVVKMNNEGNSYEEVHVVKIKELRRIINALEVSAGEHSWVQVVFGGYNSTHGLTFIYEPDVEYVSKPICAYCSDTLTRQEYREHKFFCNNQECQTKASAEPKANFEALQERHIKNTQILL